jgi:two-component system osmolarity sensor histidine kinase EnvZ
MNFSLKQLLPRSLRARLVVLVLGTVLIAQAGTMAAISHYQSKFLDQVATNYIVTTIRTLRSALAQVPADGRPDFVRDASRGQWRLWSRVLPAEAQLQRRIERRARLADGTARPRRPRSHEFDYVRRGLRGVIRHLNEELDDGTRVALSRGPVPEVFISLAPNTDNEDTPQLREWLVIPVERLDPPASTLLIAGWLGGLGALLALAALFSWHIAKPLTRLAEAADQLAAGQPQRVHPSGPSETRALGHRFNAMLDALAESESVRRTLLAGLPHDLKGPLSRMWLRVEMAEDQGLKEGLRNDLQDMQHMVDQFIGFVRGTDRDTYRYAPIPFVEWLSERVTAWTGAGTPVALSILTPDNVSVRGDAIALARLLDNLVRNALQHGAPPVEVTLNTRNGYAILTVADHGPGIAPERRTEALRPFARLDDARTRTGNVGLGLALVEAITRAHSGTLLLGSTADGGLLVEVGLPCQAEQVEDTASTLAIEDAHGDSATRA